MNETLMLRYSCLFLVVNTSSMVFAYNLYPQSSSPNETLNYECWFDLVIRLLQEIVSARFANVISLQSCPYKSSTYFSFFVRRNFIKGKISHKYGKIVFSHISMYALLSVSIIT